MIERARRTMLLGLEINSVLYPVAISQPDRTGALSPAASGPGDPSLEIRARDRRSRATQDADRVTARPEPTRPSGRPRTGPVRTALYGLVAVAIGSRGTRKRRP